MKNQPNATPCPPGWYNANSLTGAYTPQEVGRGTYSLDTFHAVNYLFQPYYSQEK